MQNSNCIWWGASDAVWTLIASAERGRERGKEEYDKNRKTHNSHESHFAAATFWFAFLSSFLVIFIWTLFPAPHRRCMRGWSQGKMWIFNKTDDQTSTYAFYFGVAAAAEWYVRLWIDFPCFVYARECWKQSNRKYQQIYRSAFS